VIQWMDEYSIGKNQRNQDHKSKENNWNKKML